MIANLQQYLEQRGYAGRVVSASRARDLKDSIAAGNRNGLINEELYKEYLSGFVFGPPDSLPEARSLIVMAARQSPVRFTFIRGGQRVAVMVPPTYLHAKETDRKMGDTLSGLLAPSGYRVVPAVVPKKLLAVRSGLAAYGRNNITYVEGMGSFHRLAAFFSDMPCDSDEWHEPTMLGRCDSCRACSTLCPTGAIGADRFQLHAERCIVFHNEKPASVPFPEWIDPAWHNCLVGCLLCQRACPEDRDNMKLVEEGAEFSGKRPRSYWPARVSIDYLPHWLKKSGIRTSLSRWTFSRGILASSWSEAGSRR